MSKFLIIIILMSKIANILYFIIFHIKIYCFLYFLVVFFNITINISPIFLKIVIVF